MASASISSGSPSSSLTGVSTISPASAQVTGFAPTIFEPTTFAPATFPSTLPNGVDHVYTTQLAAVDGSQAGGFAVVAIQGGQMTVDIHANGLTAFAAHPQAIESPALGFENVFPLVNQHTSGTAVPVHGDILFTLTQTGDTQSLTPFDLALFPHADANGTLDVVQTFGPFFNSTPGFPSVSAEFPSLENTEVVIYGDMANGQYHPQTPAVIGFLHEITPNFLPAAEINTVGGVTGAASSSDTQVLLG
jgi:hypothetical protein